MFSTTESRTASSRSGERTDLLVIPPDTSEQDAQTAMEQAAQAGNRRHTPALLANITRSARLARPAAGMVPQSIQLSAWEWEGGRLYHPYAASILSRS